MADDGLFERETMPEGASSGPRFKRITMAQTAQIVRYCDEHGIGEINRYGVRVFGWLDTHSDETLQAHVDPQKHFTTSAIRYARQSVTGLYTEAEWQRTAEGRRIVAEYGPQIRTPDDRIAELERRVRDLEAAVNGIAT